MCISSVLFSRSVTSDSLRPHELQHARPPCPSPTPRDYSNSCPSSQWCFPAISSSVVRFSSCPQSLPASGSFPMSQLMRWSKYWSFSFSISPSNEHPGLIPFRMNWLDLLAVQGTLKSLLHQICVYLWLIHVYACQKPAQPCKAIILQLKINKLQNIDKYKLPSTS